MKLTPICKQGSCGKKRSPESTATAAPLPPEFMRLDSLRDARTPERAACEVLEHEEAARRRAGARSWRTDHADDGAIRGGSVDDEASVQHRSMRSA
eukprot:15222138-Heterocapsa_arctica.AAC.1